MRIGIDLGGTKIEIVALDDDGRERFRRRIATPREDYDATLTAVARLVAEAERAVGRSTIGIGIAGRDLAGDRPDQERQLDVADRPPARRGSCASRRTRRAHCERRELLCAVGSGRRRRRGCAGRVRRDPRHRDGRRHRRQRRGGRRAPTRSAANGGTTRCRGPSPEEWPGPPCYCGRTGCIETFLSGPGLSRDHRHATGADRTRRKSPRAPTPAILSPRRRSTGTSGGWPARLASIINVVDPDVIVLGGGVSNIGCLYDRVPELWVPYVFSDRIATKLVRAKYGDSSGVRGAAWL